MPKDLENPELKAKTYQCRFLEAGVVRYENETVLIRPENVMKIAETFKGIPVCVDHKDLTLSNVDDHKVGLITREIWRDADGWANCSFLIDNKKGVGVIEEGYSVSCAYIPTEFAPGGIYHNIPYDREILAGQGVHLALVANPRYEAATIIENSKEKKTMFKIFKNKREEVSLENAVIEVDGEEVTLENAIAAFKNSKAEEAKKNAKAKMNSDDEIEVDGEKVKVSKLVSCYKSAKKNKAKKNESDEDEEMENDAASDAMDEEMEITPESPDYKVKNKAKKNEDEEDKEEKEKAKENAKFQNSLKEARRKALENANKSKGSLYKTRPERVALGKKCFGK